MSVHDGLITLHLLLLTYWLGADLGVFYASRFVLRPELSVQTRTVVARIMHVLDVSPRICLVLFLPSGIALIAEHPLGRATFGGGVRQAALWLLSLAWLGLVLADYRLQGAGVGRLVRRVDLAVRYALVAVLLGAAAYTVLVPAPFGVSSNPDWLGLKVGAYALAIACGIAIRARLRPFGVAFAELSRSGSSPAVEAALAGSLRSAIPFVLVIWALVLAAAVLGVAQPGSTWSG